ncbi:MAG: hypothetical protein HGA56_10250, partial [Chlorobiaceae bacterium]|nr:hypothetical protein [Chlorobiaceae bacterium]
MVNVLSPGLIGMAQSGERAEKGIKRELGSHFAPDEFECGIDRLWVSEREYRDFGDVAPVDNPGTGDTITG